MLRTHTLAGVLITAFTSTLAAQNWVELYPANSPGGLNAQAIAYDMINDQMVMFGGTRDGIRIDETWLFDGTDWAMATPTTVPPARVAHPMAYDPARGRIVMYGGIAAAGGLLGDTWEWDGTDWYLMSPTTTPGPRRSHPMVYHPGLGTCVVHGGNTGAGANDTWQWNGIDWAQIATANAPSARWASDMAYDPVGNGLVLFSGYPNAPQDTWYFDNTDWAQLATLTSPPGRWDHTMATDPIRGRVMMFGGTATADTWEFDGTDWVDMAPATLPPPRNDDYMAYDLTRGHVLMFGGGGNSDTWAYQTPPQPGFAASIPYGVGCMDEASASFYELFAATTFDLENSTVQLIPTPTNDGYFVNVLPAANWFTPTSANLGLADETVDGPHPLGFTLNYLGGSITDIFISSNGFTMAETMATAQYFNPATDPGRMFNGPARWSPYWSDLNPANGGTVHFDIDPATGDAVVTFLAVPEYSNSGSLTFQIAFSPTGIIEYRYQTMTSVAQMATVGWTPGNGAKDPGSIDLSAPPGPILTSPDKFPLWQRADLRPVVGNTVTLTTGNIPAGSPLGATLFGLQEYNPGIDLTAIGMPGCFQYMSMDAVGVAVPANGMVSGTFTVPNIATLAGVEIKSQGAALAPGYNTLSAITSNGVKMTIDVN